MSVTPSEPARGERASQRLHPSSLFFSLGSVARRLLIPGILLLYFSRGTGAEVWMIILFIPAALGSVFKYFSYRYRFDPDEMVIREGIITRNERSIPYARIQNIDLRQNPLHRVLGVAEVRLETASGEKPEAVMRVLSLPAVEQMRERVFQGREVSPDATGRAEEGPEPIDRPRALVRLPWQELALLGLLSNRGLALVAAAAGALWQFGSYRMEDELEQVVGEVQRVVDAVELPGPVATALSALGAAVVLFLVLKLLSAAWFVVQYHGFTLSRRGDDLRAEYGMLTRVSVTIPRHRIQVLSTKSGPVQRRLGRLSVQVETAGGAAGREGDEGARRDRLWLAPSMRASDLPMLLSAVLPQVDFAAKQWRGLAPGARGRIMRRVMILGTAVITLAVVPLGPWALAAILPLTALAVAHAGLSVRHTRYSLSERAVHFRSGWLRRRMSVVRFSKIQTLTLKQSPFDRRARMGGVRVDTAGAGKIGHPVEIRYLEIETARRIHDRLYDEAGRTVFQW